MSSSDESSGQGNEGVVVENSSSTTAGEITKASVTKENSEQQSYEKEESGQGNGAAIGVVAEAREMAVSSEEYSYNVNNNNNNDDNHDDNMNNTSGKDENGGHFDSNSSSANGDRIKIFLGMVPLHMTDTELQTFLSQYGTIVEFFLMRDRITQGSRGCAFVTFDTKESGLRCMEDLHEKKPFPGGKKLAIAKPALNTLDQQRKLFVAMLPRTTTEEELRPIFEVYGEIEELYVIRGYDMKSKGCAFVKYAKLEDSQNAIKSLHDKYRFPDGIANIIVRPAETDKEKNRRKATTAMQASMYYHPGYPAQAPHHMQGYMQQPQHQYNPYSAGASSGAGGYGASSGAGGYGASGAGGYGASTASSGYGASTASSGYGASTASSGYGASNASSGYGTSSYSASGAYDYSGGAAGTGVASHHRQGYQPMTGDIKEDLCTLFVHFLPPHVKDNDLYQLFSPFGTVLKSSVKMDPITAQSKCYGFVTYDNPSSAQLAIQQMNGFQIGAKRLKVALKTRKVQTPGAPY